LDEIGSAVYEEMSFKVKVNGRRTKSDHKSSPCHFVTGELKRGCLFCYFRPFFILSLTFVIINNRSITIIIVNLLKFVANEAQSDSKKYEQKVS
jgi:hypothetical protein